MLSRWRGRGYDPNRQRYQGGGMRERFQDRHGGHRNQGNNMGGPQNWGPPGFGQEQHVPVRKFNSAEAKDALKKGN